jgi:ribosomal protein L9
MVLLEDVQGMGSQGDIVMANLSHARNYLVPFKKAYYVPRRMGKPILPDGWTVPVKESETILEPITPAVVYVPYTEKSTGALESVENDVLMTDQDIRTKLATITLVFSRVLIHQDTDKIFGSVNAADIQTELQEKYGIELDKESIDCRLKTIGNHKVTMQVGGIPVEVAININPQ